MEENIKAIVEGLIFVNGDEGITDDDLAKLLATPKHEVIVVLDELKEDYRSEQHGIELVNYGGMYKFVSKAIIHPHAQALFQTTKKNNLSPAALETLAIIAYKQPITRVEIEEIRGVGSDAMLRRLALRDLIMEVGRADAPGMPILYGVTKEFLDIFKLISIDELPDLPDYSDQMEMDLYE
ncbi:MAG: SMC-Scp complex subunit ScpB [Erysipelothrix sp.]|nr:SMC-Scp complex subunit ScpB [Erysipelothrix sp.]